MFQTTTTENERDNTLVQSADPPSGGGSDSTNTKDSKNSTNKNTAALATGIVLGCLAVMVMGAHYVRHSRRRKYYGRDYAWEDDLVDEEQGGGSGEYVGGDAPAVMVTPVKAKDEAKGKSKSQPDDDGDEDDEDSHRTAPMTPMSPEASPSKTSPPPATAAAAAGVAAASPARASVGVDQIVSDLTRDEAELQNLRRQNSLDQYQDQDQSWLSDGLRQPSATGVEPATGDAGDLAAVATTLFVAADFGAGGEILDGDRSGFHEPIDEEGGEEESSASTSADSHEESTGEEEATVTSLSAVSLTPSDVAAFNGNRNTSMTIMKDQLVGSGSGDPFGETGHPSQGAGGGPVSPMVPVPSVNFSSFKRREKNIHLRPNCLTVEGVVGINEAAIAPEPDDDENDDVDVAQEQEASPLEDTPDQSSVASSDEPAEGDQDASSTNDDGMFIVSSPSSEEATNGGVSPTLLDATPLNPALKMVEPKILSSIKASQESLSKSSGLPPAISEDSAQLDPAPSASSPKVRSPQFLPTPAPLKDIGRDTSLDRTVDFDAVDWNPRATTSQRRHLSAASITRSIRRTTCRLTRKNS